VHLCTVKSLKHLNKYFWKYRWRLGLGFLFIILTNIFTVYGPQLINEAVNFLQQSVDSAQNAAEGEVVSIAKPESFLWLQQWFGLTFNLGDGDSVELSNLNWGSIATIVALLLGLIYIASYIIKGVFSFMTRQTIIIMSRLVEYDLKNEIFDHYQELDIAFYKRNNTGDLMNRISEDVSKVRMYIGPAVMYTLNLLVLIVMVVFVMAWINWELTLWALAPLPFMSIAIYKVSTIMNKRSENVQRQQSKLSTIVQETISGIRVLKAYTREDFRKETFAHECDDYKMKVLKQVKVDALFMPIIVLLVGLSTILTIYMGGLKVIDGSMQIGQVFQFVFYVNLLTWPFASVGWVTSLVQKAEASQTRINEFLSAVPDVKSDHGVSTEIKGDIAFKNVSFTYPESGIQALKNVSFKVVQGQTLAIIGRTGSGKSTIANLLCRLYDPISGEIQVDERDLKEHHLGALRTKIGYVPQDVFLFSDSIYNNISFGVDGVEQSVVVQAAKDADIHENILGFPQGYQTLLGERGINLSGGQKQRVSIARAIIKNPQILIFDDCLSAVDTETEEKILTSLKGIMSNKTTLIISHRVSSIKHADRIIVLDEGEIKEEGTHEALLQSNGIYADLYQKQLLEDRAA
jgi:ATP-binding cassette, subfamily B, multidrug efflux pump